MKSVTVACFCHNSCCLQYGRTLTSSETVLQCRGQASFLSSVSQSSVAMHSRCGGIFHEFYYKFPRECASSVKAARWVGHCHHLSNAINLLTPVL